MPCFLKDNGAMDACGMGRDVDMSLEGSSREGKTATGRAWATVRTGVRQRLTDL